MTIVSNFLIHLGQNVLQEETIILIRDYFKNQSNNLSHFHFPTKIVCMV